MNDKIPILRGRRLVEPRQPLEIPDWPEWMTDPRRRCSPEYPDAYQWTSNDRSDLTVAARKCREHCPVLAECHAWAVEQRELHFCWGGLVMSHAANRARTAAAEVDAPARPARLTRAEAKARLEAAVREHWLDGQPDSVIALKVGVALGTVVNVRKRLRLPALYGPNGRRIAREQVSA